MSQYITFQKQEKPEGRKTDIYNVISKHTGGVIGQLKWFGNWRKYCLYPERNTIWDVNCLNDVNEFINILKQS